MIEVKKEGIILRKTDLEFENEGVFNPAVCVREIVFILFRGQCKRKPQNF